MTKYISLINHNIAFPFFNIAMLPGPPLPASPTSCTSVHPPGSRAVASMPTLLWAPTASHHGLFGCFLF